MTVPSYFQRLFREYVTGPGSSVVADQSEGGGGVDVRDAINDLQVQIARLNFEVGLSDLDYDNGEFEIYSDLDQVVSTTNTEIVEGSEIGGNGYAKLQDGQTDGSVLQVEFDCETIPEEIVAADEMYEPLSSNADVTYTISDENGNSITITRNDVDSVVDATALNTFRLTVEVSIVRDSESVQTPKLDSHAEYVTGSQPPGDYFDAEQVGAPARTELYVSDDPTATTDFQINSTKVK